MHIFLIGTTVPLYPYRPAMELSTQQKIGLWQANGMCFFREMSYLLIQTFPTVWEDQHGLNENALYYNNNNNNNNNNNSKLKLIERHLQ